MPTHASALIWPWAAAVQTGGTKGSEPNAAQTKMLFRSLDEFLSGVEARAFRIARFAVGDTEDALDIVQDAMLKLAERYPDKPSEEWPPLFHRILQSRINDWHRRTKVRAKWRRWLNPLRADDTSDPGLDPMEQVADPMATTPPERLSDHEFVVDLERALSDLPLRQQQTFLLRAWEGLDVRETAQAMGCSSGSVKTHYSRALRRLRDELGMHWDTPSVAREDGPVDDADNQR